MEDLLWSGCLQIVVYDIIAQSGNDSVVRREYMRYEFTKMQSLGNDFIVLDGVSNEINLSAGVARKLADRHFGVGCDQVLLAQPDKSTTAEFVFRIFNQDGSEVEQCGNGARCLARFLYDLGLTKNKTIRVRTQNLVMTLNINMDESVTVEMGIPEFTPENIPFVADQPASIYTLDLGGDKVKISAVAIGNPHAVQLVQDITIAPVESQGSLIENHPRFPARVNAGFMQVVARDHVNLRVYERGAGETLGCGSGACAAVAAGISLGMLDSQVRVSLPGGDALVDWNGMNQPIFLSGSAQFVFRGSIEL